MRFAALFLIGLFFITPCIASDFPWTCHQDIMFYNASSDIAGYRVIDHVPERADQVSLTSVAITAADGEQTLGTWLTLPFPEQTTVAPGIWIFRIYAVASSDSGTTRMHFRIFNRSSDGTVTYLFFGNAISQDINKGTVPSEYDTYYARRNMTTLFPGDRLGIQINVSTNSAAARTVTLDVAGNTNASYVSTGYWLGSTPPTPTPTIPNLPAPPIVPPAVDLSFVCIGATLVFLLLILLGRWGVI